jgi:hypothetical protein
VAFYGLEVIKFFLYSYDRERITHKYVSEMQNLIPKKIATHKVKRNQSILKGKAIPVTGREGP